ncbi:hypothetical protein [Methanosarcina sp. UBA289]|uniref:hypothetical protein n=1 Tax=Methanosarcina sp. UBA289 TaxID=1915574 RepID=UPI0025D5596D|nr:hypothetical protein [Methanosarcina sp. UBA289]
METLERQIEWKKQNSSIEWQKQNNIIEWQKVKWQYRMARNRMAILNQKTGWHKLNMAK